MKFTRYFAIAWAMIAVAPGTARASGKGIKIRRASALETAHSAFLVSLLLPAFLLTSCAVVPMRTRTVGTTGEENNIDFKFIQAGKTTKDEVSKKLTWMDTGLKHQRLFWGRWYGSSSGVGSIFIPTEIPLPIPNGTRYWHVHNLLVEFNAKGVVERFGEFSESKVNEELERWLKEVSEPPLNLSAPLVIEMRTASRSMTLTDDLLQFVLWNGQTFSVPRRDIARFKIHNAWSPGDQSWFGSIPAPLDLNIVFSFSRERPGGKGNCKCLGVNVTPADYLTLLRYVPQAATHR